MYTLLSSIFISFQFEIQDSLFNVRYFSLHVISNGTDIPGTVVLVCSPEFKEVYNSADIIISRGQGNFETLNDNREKRIFFLFQVKCPVISLDCGLPVGAFAIIENLVSKNKCDNMVSKKYNNR